MHQPLLILGASVRAAAQSAKRAGFEPIAVDCFADEDLTGFCQTTVIAKYPEEFLSVALSMPAVDWIYTGGLENYPSLVDQISTRHRLLGTSGKILQQVRDPRRLHAALCQAGFDSPAVYFGRNPREVEANAGWVQKPFRSGGGVGVRLFDKAGDDSARSSTTTYFQRYIEGMPVGAVFVGFAGKAVLRGVTQQLIGCEWAGVGEFRYCGSVGPLRLSETVTREFEAIGTHLVREFGLIGLFGIDAVVVDERVWTIEVNPRYTASVELLERAFGFSAIAAHVAACRGEDVAGRWSDLISSDENADHKIFGKAIVYATRDIEIGLPLFSEEAKRINADALWPIVADIPRSECKISRGDPIVSIFAEASTDAAVVHSLQTWSIQVIMFFEKWFFEKKHRSP